MAVTAEPRVDDGVEQEGAVQAGINKVEGVVAL
jgi:hypothetical protein